MYRLGQRQGCGFVGGGAAMIAASTGLDQFDAAQDGQAAGDAERSPPGSASATRSTSRGAGVARGGPSSR